MNFRIILVLAVGCLTPALGQFDYKAFKAAGGQALSWDTRSLISTAEYPCPNEGFFTHPKNCSRFYRCVDFTSEGLIFSRYLFECPQDNVFAQTIEACVPGVCPDGLPVIGESTPDQGSAVEAAGPVGEGSETGSGSEQVVETDQTPQPGATDGSAVEGAGGADTGSTSGSEAETVTDTSGPSDLNPGDEPMPESGTPAQGPEPASTSAACNPDKPYKQSEKFCNIFYKCGVPDELYACNQGTAFSDDKQMCRLTSFEEELCTGKEIFNISAAAFRAGFGWKDVAVFPGAFPIVANAVPFTFANLRSAVEMVNSPQHDSISPTTVFSSPGDKNTSPGFNFPPVDNAEDYEFGINHLQETLDKMKEQTAALQATAFGNNQEADIHAMNYHEDELFDIFRSFDGPEPVFGAIDHSTGDVYAAFPVDVPVFPGPERSFPIGNSYEPFSQNEFGLSSQMSTSPFSNNMGVIPFLQQYSSPNMRQGFAPNPLTHSFLYGQSPNVKTEYKPLASLVEYFPFAMQMPNSALSLNPTYSPFSSNTASSPFPINKPSSQFSINKPSSPFSASSNFLFGQPSSQFSFGQPSPQLSFGQPGQQFSFGQPSQHLSFGQPIQQFSLGEPSQQLSLAELGSQLSFGQPSPQLPYGQPGSQLSIGLPTSPFAFRQPSPQFGIFSPSEGGMSFGGIPFGFGAHVSQFPQTYNPFASASNKAAEDFINQYFAASLIGDNKETTDNKEDGADAQHVIESTPGQVTLDNDTIEKLLSGQSSASPFANAFGIPSLDNILDRQPITGVAARNKDGELFHVIPVNEEELAFLHGIEGIQSRNADPSMHIVPFTDETLSQMEVGDALLASLLPKKK